MPFERPKGRGQRTIERNLQIGSVGCAPTPIQYFARSMSSWIFLCTFPLVSYDVFLGKGSYVPITSRGLLFRAVLRCGDGVSARASATTIPREKGTRSVPCLGHDDVVEGGVFSPKAGQSDFDHHCGRAAPEFPRTTACFRRRRGWTDGMSLRLQFLDGGRSCGQSQSACCGRARESPMCISIHYPCYQTPSDVVLDRDLNIDHDPTT